MKYFKDIVEAHPNSKIYDKCWDGYRKVPGKKRGEEGSCREKSVKEDSEPFDRERQLVKKLGQLGSMIVQNPPLWDKYSEAIDNDNVDWIIALIQDRTGANREEVTHLAELFGEIGGGLGRLVDFAWAVKEGTWEEDFLKPFLQYKKQGMTEGEGNLEIGQQMAKDGITYSPEKEKEIINMMADYMTKAGMSPKTIRHLLSYDEDYIPDQLSFLPRQGMTESSPELDRIRRQSAKRIMANKKAWDALSPEEKEKQLQLAPQLRKSGVAEGWREEAEDMGEWAEYVRTKLMKTPEQQRHSVAQQLSQIEVRNFGSELVTGYNFDPKTGKPTGGRPTGMTKIVRDTLKALTKPQGLGAAGYVNLTPGPQEIDKPDDRGGQDWVVDTNLGWLVIPNAGNAPSRVKRLLWKAYTAGPEIFPLALEIWEETGDFTEQDYKDCIIKAAELRNGGGLEGQAYQQYNQQQGVAEGTDNPYGYKVGQTVKLDNGQQGRVIDIFDDSIEVLLVGGRTVTVDFRDAQVIGEQGVAKSETPEKELERLKLRQNAEHGRASLQRQADTQARIRELEKQIQGKQSGVKEAGRYGRSSYYNPLDQERREQEYRDQSDRDFKYQERSWDEASVMYRFDTDVQRLKQKSIVHAHMTQARSEGWRDSHEQAMRDHGYFPSKFKQGEFVKKGTDGKWIKVFPYASKATESDMSGLLHAARHHNREFIVTAKTAEGDTKRYRVKAQSERVAREKFQQHHNQAEILDVKEDTKEATNMPDNSLGYKNTLAVMKAADSSQEATINLGGEPVTLDYPEARFIAGKYKAFLRAGRQEEFFGYMSNAQQFDSMMKQLRGLHDKQKAFKGSVPGERGVPGETTKPWTKESTDYEKSIPAGADEGRVKWKCPSCGVASGVAAFRTNSYKCPNCSEPLPVKGQMGLKQVSESLRLVGKHGDGAKTAKVYKDHEWGEYRVKFYTDGNHEGEDADYHTDDKDDANDTAKSWISKGQKVAENTYWCRVEKTRKLIPEGYKKAPKGYIIKE